MIMGPHKMSSGRWERPKSVPYPQIWRRCTGRRPMADGKIPKFRIQDVTEDIAEEVVSFMSTYFVKDETICANTQLWLDPVSMQEIQDLWREKLKQKVALVALVEDDDNKTRIAGCNITSIAYKQDQDQPNKFQGVPLRKFVDALNYPGLSVDVFERYGVQEYLVGLGLSISPEYRGQGLGLEIIRARLDLGRAVGLRLTVTVFTAIQSQELAAKVGMEVLLEVPYDDYKVDGEIVFPVAFPKSMKMMARTIE